MEKKIQSGVKESHLVLYMSSIKQKIHNSLRELSDHNGAFNRLYRAYRYVQFSLQGAVVNTKRFLRSRGVGGKKYKKLLAYKNIHSGERCFIIATGPSLTMEDIESLKNEYTISMNSICKLYGQTDWRPTYYAVQDDMVFEKLEGVIRAHKEVPVFISDNVPSKFRREKEWVEFPTDTKYHSYDILKQKYYAEFSDDAYDIVYDGYSIAYSCIELAVYMGFKEIYLLGTDCTYLGEKEHFVDSGVEDRARKYATPKLIVGYEEVKKYADSHGIKVYNATRGGVLEVFPRVKLEDILKTHAK